MGVNRWTDVSGGPFSEASDWSSNQVPGLGDDVVVDLEGSYTISVTSAFSINGLSIAQPASTLRLQTPGSTNTVLGDFTNSGTLALEQQFSSGGGTSVVVSGTLTNSGAIYVGSPYAALSAADTITAGHLVNTGSINVFAGSGPTGALATIDDTGDAAPSMLLGSLSLSGNAVFDFGAGGGVVSVGSGATLSLGSADSRLTTSGDLSGNTALTGLVSNAGTLSLNGAALVSAAPAAFTNTGTLALSNGGSIGPRTDLINGGTLALEQQFSAGGGTSLVVSGTLTNSGAIYVGGPYAALSAADTITAGHLVNTGSINVFAGCGADRSARDDRGHRRCGAFDAARKPVAERQCGVRLRCGWRRGVCGVRRDVIAWQCGLSADEIRRYIGQHGADRTDFERWHALAERGGTRVGRTGSVHQHGDADAIERRFDWATDRSDQWRVAGTGAAVLFGRRHVARGVWDADEQRRDLCRQPVCRVIGSRFDHGGASGQHRVDQPYRLEQRNRDSRGRHCQQRWIRHAPARLGPVRDRAGRLCPNRRNDAD